jgi:uncharacterized protein (TIGR02284 family)
MKSIRAGTGRSVDGGKARGPERSRPLKRRTTMEKTMLDKLNSLIQLDIDAVYCYDEAIKRIEDDDIATTLQEYRGDHERHIDDLSEIVTSNGGKAPKRSPDIQGILLQGMTALRSAIGTEGALKAMETNEKKTNEEYGKARSWDVPPSIHDVLEKNFDDEKRHLAFVQSQLHAMA